MHYFVKILLIIALLGQTAANPRYNSSHKPVYYTFSGEVTMLAYVQGKVWGASPGGILELCLERKKVVKHTPVRGDFSLPVTFIGSYKGKPAAGGSSRLCLYEDGIWKKVDTPSVKIDVWFCNDDKLYAAGEEKVYFFSENRWDEIASYEKLPNSQVLMQMFDDKLYLLSGAKVYLIREDGVEYIKSIPSSHIPLCFTLYENRLWIGTTKGLLEQGEDDWILHSFPSNSESSMVTALVSQDSILTAFLYQEGVFQLEKNGWRKIAVNIDSHQQRGLCLLKQDDFLIWGTSQRGIAVLSDSSLESFYVKGELPENDIFDIAKFNDSIYASTFETGIGVLKEEDWEALEQMPSLWMRHLAVWDNALWVRDSDGTLYKYGNDIWEKVLVKPAWCSYLKALKRGLVIGGYGGFLLMNNSSEDKLYGFSPLRGQVITGAAQDGENIWAGTAKGGCILLKNRDGLWESHHYPLTAPWVTCIAVHNGGVFAGTFNGGIFKYNNDKFVEALPCSSEAEKHILCLDNRNEDELWAGTRGRVLIIKKNQVFTLRDDEIQLREVQTLLADKECLWAGTPYGLVFLPAKWLENNIIPYKSFENQVESVESKEDV